MSKEIQNMGTTKSSAGKLKKRKVSPGETLPEYTIPDLAIILSLVYMGAGLPPEPALRSALADYLHSFSGEKQSA